jgi:hypothetical protein
MASLIRRSEIPRLSMAFATTYHEFNKSISPRNCRNIVFASGSRATRK